MLAIAASLAGYTRMTYSLAVIIMETTQELNLFVPIIFTILTANATGYIFTRGLYERAVRAKQMPILIDEVPFVNQSMIAEQIMASNVLSLKNVDKVENILKVLQSSHHGFPVLNLNGKCTGLIPKNFLVIILRYQAFYKYPIKEI